MISRRGFILGGIAAVVAPLAVEAQKAGKVHRIGFLRVGRPPKAWVDGLRQGLS
jgi:hypothetical protein